MPNVCLDCGAIDDGDGSCRDFFDSFLNLEFTNPEYGEVHAFTVGIFMIQHYQYTDGALAWMKDILAGCLNKNWTAKKLRQVTEKYIANSSTKSGIIRSKNDPPAMRVNWKMTIADVAQNYEDAESYRVLIKEWARITLRQLDEIAK